MANMLHIFWLIAAAEAVVRRCPFAAAKRARQTKGGTAMAGSTATRGSGRGLAGTTRRGANRVPQLSFFTSNDDAEGVGNDLGDAILEAVLSDSGRPAERLTAT